MIESERIELMSHRIRRATRKAKTLGLRIPSGAHIDPTIHRVVMSASDFFERQTRDRGEPDPVVQKLMGSRTPSRGTIRPTKIGNFVP